MVSCGMYGQSGEFLVRTGMPAKSGVGGGIMAAIPGKGGLGVVGRDNFGVFPLRVGVARVDEA